MPATTGTQPVRLAGTICGSAALNQALGARAHGLDRLGRRAFGPVDDSKDR
ncbi:MAG: hypothetical protein KDA73_09860 [Rhodobacteraceae bacterium]|nr:hypothetical protein [Paracoccaceae bacterium]